jgi:hypothetical protein
MYKAAVVTIAKFTLVAEDNKIGLSIIWMAGAMLFDIQSPYCNARLSILL